LKRSEEVKLDFFAREKYQIMAFRFSLASVLRLRESIEKMEEQSLQKIDMEIARVLHVIDELDEKTVKLRSARDRVL